MKKKQLLTNDFLIIHYKSYILVGHYICKIKTLKKIVNFNNPFMLDCVVMRIYCKH